MIDIEEVVKRLEKLIGTEFNEKKVKGAFESIHEILILGEKYGIFTRYLVFEDIFDNSGLIYVVVDTNNIIIKIDIEDYK